MREKNAYLLFVGRRRVRVDRGDGVADGRGAVEEAAVRGESAVDGAPAAAGVEVCRVGPDVVPIPVSVGQRIHVRTLKQHPAVRVRRKNLFGQSEQSITLYALNRV
jgi:hypothetical protein